MAFGNGNDKKPPVKTYTPPKPTLEDFIPEQHKQYRDDLRYEPEPPPLVKMERLTKEIERDRIREVALQVSVLTYGEILKFEEGLKGAGAPNELDLKPILHKWALDYLKKDDPHD